MRLSDKHLDYLSTQIYARDGDSLFWTENDDAGQIEADGFESVLTRMTVPYARNDWGDRVEFQIGYSVPFVPSPWLPYYR